MYFVNKNVVSVSNFVDDEEMARELDRETVRKFIAENIKTIEWFGSTDTRDRYIIKPVTK